MYNPEGNDNNKEFIEIYSEENINLSNFIITDSDSNDSLTLLQYYDSVYYLITEEGFNFSDIEASVYSAGAAIGNNLNTKDSIFLYYDSTLIDNVSYEDICKDGYSLEYSNGTFYCSIYAGGTPGKANSDRNKDYSNIIINEFFPDPAGEDNAPMPDGEFIEIYNKGNNETDLAGIYLKDSSNHQIYITDTTTVGGTTIEPKSYLSVYTNEFSGFLNNEGFEEIYLYDPYGNLIDKVTYADSRESLSWSLMDDYWNYKLPSPNEENPKEEVQGESSFKILGIEDLGEDNETEFGEIIKGNFYVYKGNTSKSSIKLYIENDDKRITKITKADLPGKYTNYSLTLPIQIEPNCDQKYEDGDYYVNLGWTSLSKEEDSFKIKIDGINMDNCGKIYVERQPKKGTLTYNLVEAPATVEIDKDFTMKVELTNNDGEDHLVDVYSYVYRGSKSYSGEREANKKRILVKAGQTKGLELDNHVYNAEPGDYLSKIRIKRDDQKTEKEITQPIKVLSGNIEQSKEEAVEVKQESIELSEEDTKDRLTLLESAKTPKIIYESPSMKSTKSAIWFLLALLVIYSSIITFKALK